ncbi:hypothetical protein KR51_00025080, partial [Rubidibacter lacunae KORDI 51-2]
MQNQRFFALDRASSMKSYPVPAATTSGGSLTRYCSCLHNSCS